MLSVCNLALLYIIKDPSPVLPPIHSPTTAPIGAKQAATLSLELLLVLLQLVQWLENGLGEALDLGLL